jgi:hypothetical protein
MIIFSTTRGPGPVKRGSRLETDELVLGRGDHGETFVRSNLDKCNKEEYGPFRLGWSCFSRKIM